jgi:hypothetical protein
MRRRYFVPITVKVPTGFTGSLKSKRGQKSPTELSSIVSFLRAHALADGLGETTNLRSLDPVEITRRVMLTIRVVPPPTCTGGQPEQVPKLQVSKHSRVVEQGSPLNDPPAQIDETQVPLQAASS